MTRRWRKPAAVGAATLWLLGALGCCPIKESADPSAQGDQGSQGAAPEVGAERVGEDAPSAVDAGLNEKEEDRAAPGEAPLAPSRPPSGHDEGGFAPPPAGAGEPQEAASEEASSAPEERELKEAAYAAPATPSEEELAPRRDAVAGKVERMTADEAAAFFQKRDWTVEGEVEEVSEGGRAFTLSRQARNGLALGVGDPNAEHLPAGEVRLWFVEPKDDPAAQALVAKLERDPKVALARSGRKLVVARALGETSVEVAQGALKDLFPW